MDNQPIITVAELFAGVGGFRLALDGYHSNEHPEFDTPAAGPFKTVWANQWEPPGTHSKQFAWRCYEEHFGKDSCVNEDIAIVLDKYEAGEIEIPDAAMVVGGFPCQDYSVAKPLSMAGGIEGEKGVLWWSIYRFLRLKGPKYCLFENVDRLLKSPAKQRGRDFAIILSCLNSLGYSVEWRVVNSAEYGFPQRRKRVFIYAEKDSDKWNLPVRVTNGIMAKALPIANPDTFHEVDVSADPYVITQSFNPDGGRSPFENAGVMQDGVALTSSIVEEYNGPRKTLGSVVLPVEDVPDEFFVPSSQLDKWRYLKGSKRERRVSKSGHEYWYSEGSMAFPDLLENPSRTILTGEGGKGASRFKHIIQCDDGRYRRLTPDELDMLQGFPKGWTATGMTDGRRAFCMGNALVVGIPHLIGCALAFESCH